jgi:putative DNA primase/helicase
LLPVRPFDYDLLPDSLRPWVQDISNRMQCPPDYVAVAVMVSLGAVLGSKLGLRPKRLDDWLVVGNMWGGVVGAPGVMKSPAISEALRLMQRLETVALLRHQAVLQSWKNDQEYLKIKYKADTRNALKATLMGIEIDPENFPVNPKGNVEPQSKRYVINDSSVEALGAILEYNPNGAMVHRDELIGLLKWLDKPGNEGARSFYLQAWNGTDGYTFDRIGRGLNKRVEGCCLSVLGSIQPSIIEQYLTQAIATDGGDGLMSRFQLLVWPDVSEDWANVDIKPDSEAIENAYGVFYRLDALDPLAIGQIEGDSIPFLRFDEEAQVIFDEWRENFEPRLRRDIEHPAFVSHLSKYRKLVPAMSLLIHLADNEAGPVGKFALLKALAWVEYLESHARRAYASVMQVAEGSASALLRRIRQGDVSNPFTSREVYLKHWENLSTPEEMQEAVQTLCDLDYLKAENIKTSGRPKVQFWINPKVEIA